MPRPMRDEYFILGGPATVIARRLCINVRHVNAAVRSGELETVPFGTKRIILTRDALKWCENRKQSHAHLPRSRKSDSESLPQRERCGQRRRRRESPIREGSIRG